MLIHLVFLDFELILAAIRDQILSLIVERDWSQAPRPSLSLRLRSGNSMPSDTLVQAEVGISTKGGMVPLLMSTCLNGPCLCTDRILLSHMATKSYLAIVH